MLRIIGAIFLSFLFISQTLAAENDTWTDMFVKKEFEAALKNTEGMGSESAISIRGWSLFMLDRYGESLATFKLLEEKSEYNFDGRLGIAWCSIKLGQYDTAEEYLDKADDTAKDWQRRMVYDARGWLALNKGNFEEADDLFLTENRVYPKGVKYTGDASVGRGWISVRTGDWEEAEKLFKRGLKRNKECYFCLDGLARAALAREDYDEALKLAIEGLDISYSNSGLQGIVGTALAYINDAERSYQTYNDLISKFPDVSTFQSSLGYVYLAKSDLKKAESAFRKALEINNTDPVARAGIGALQYSKAAIVADGWEAYYQADFETALSHFDAKLESARAEGNAAALDGRGWALLALKRPKEARASFKEAIDQDNEYFYANSGLIAAERTLLVLYNRAWALVNLGRYNEASETFERSRSQTPSDMMWLVDDGLAWINYYQQNYDSAEAIFGKIVASNSGAYLSKTGLGMIALKNGDYQQSLGHLMESFVLNPYQALNSYVNPANQLVDEGQFGEAQKILELAERVFPYSADIQFLYAKASFGTKDDQTAAKKLNTAAYLAPSYIDPVFDEIKVSNKLLNDGLLSLGWGLYYAGLGQKALQRFDQYFEAGGTSLSGHLGRGWTALSLAEYDKAEDSFKEANDEQDQADAFSGLGWVELGREDIKAAEKYFKKSLKLFPGYFSAQNGLANIQFQKTEFVSDGWEAYYKGDYEAALEAFNSKRSAAKKKKNPAAEDGRGWTLLAMGKPKKATKAFNASLKIDSSFFYSQSGLIAAERTSLVLYNTAWAQLNVGMFEEAEQSFIKARDEAKPEFQWLIDDGLAWIKFYQKDYQAAENSFSKIVSNEPNAYLSKKGLGFVALEKGEFDQAVSHIFASVLQNPYQIISTYIKPVQKLIEANENAKARELLKLGLGIYPLSADLNFQMAKVFKSTNDNKTAGLYVAVAASYAPLYIDPVFDDLNLSDADAKQGLMNLSWGLYFARDNERALERFNQLHNSGISDSNIDRGRAFTLFRLAKYDEALPLLEKASKKEPDELLPIDEILPIPGTNQYWTLRYSAGSTIGWIQYHLGNYSKAENQFQTILKDNPFWIDALTGYGYTLLKQNKNTDAESAFIKALAISPFYPDAIQGLELAKLE